ncbi:MAG TPA: hypothetical protein VF173_36615 [Thermoanaerobaculia bacterium]|nr:hypothetical protein [Thermoanaerobaculia bacterium]
MFYGQVVVTPPSMTEASWLMQLQVANPEQQDALLSQASPMSLSLTTTTFLETLREIQPWMIRQEPALSTYWELRNRLEQSLKQERHG